MSVKAGMFMFLFLICFGIGVGELCLKQVLVLGRHNIRTPLTSRLERVTSKELPKWNEEFGHLTSKGRLLESYMGEYFAEWMRNVGFIKENCPQDLNIYANGLERTRESARVFTEAAFRNCNVTVYYKTKDVMDPLFHPVIHNTSEEIKNIIIDEMNRKLNGLNLTEAYLELNRIIDIKNSKICEEEQICDLATAKNEIYYKIGDEPNVIGPLAIGNWVVDSFLMEYYNGVPFDSIAWGEIRNYTYELVTKITEADQIVRFGSPNLAKNVAEPLIRYMIEILLKDKPKFTLLVGHDSNMNSVMAAIGFKSFKLPNQYEKTPVGGKIVFQKWYDEESSKYLLKIEYVYQSFEQLREGVKLSLQNPPNRVVLEIKHCEVDKNGFCSWEDFVNVIKNLYKPVSNLNII